MKGFAFKIWNAKGIYINNSISTVKTNQRVYRKTLHIVGNLIRSFVGTSLTGTFFNSQDSQHRLPKSQISSTTSHFGEILEYKKKGSARYGTFIKTFARLSLY